MRVIIIPGNGNTDISLNWYLYVKEKLEKLGLEVVAKNMPDPDLARKEYWIPFIEQQLGGDDNAILIGHSSGAVAILRYLEDHKAQGAVIVGVYHTDLGMETEKQSGYFDGEWQWSKIRQNVKWIIEFASTDDPYIPIDEPISNLVHSGTNPKLAGVYSPSRSEAGMNRCKTIPGNSCLK